LAVDAGNTNISFALFEGQTIKIGWDIPTVNYSRAKLSGYLKKRTITAAFICSVVPQINKKLCADIKQIKGVKPAVIGKDIIVPIKSLYRKPQQLGQDRLVNAYAARMIYQKPIIVVSCGTAITIDAVSKDKTYLGGLIMPGLNLLLTVLNEKTARLPLIKLAAPGGLFGRDTKSSILNGVVLGTAGAVDNLIKKIKLELNSNALVVGTGGGIRLLSKFTENINRINLQLNLKGIYLIYKQANRRHLL